MSEYTLLTEDELNELPVVLQRRRKFKKLIKDSVTNADRTFSNCICLQGKPGTGKTTLISEHLTQLQNEGVISRYTRVAGHVTPTSLYNLLKDNSETDSYGRITVTVLDDIDALYDAGALELMKAAFDTKNDSTDNRRVYYLARLGKTTGSSSQVAGSFKYNGYCIIITNNDLTSNPTPHQQAVLDRIHVMNADLNKSDFKIFNTYLTQEYLNRNPDNLPEGTLDQISDFFKSEVREWFDNDVFEKANILFSIRLLKKFIDLINMFGDDWKEFSLPYKKLSAMNKLVINSKLKAGTT